MDIISKLKDELKVQKWQVEAAVKHIDEGNTIPFIAMYRKEVTGSLNDEVLRDLNERLSYLRNLEERKEQVISSIEEQGQLTDELKEKILAAETLVVVEDLYRPYKPKRRTRATVAREKGLEPLAQLILAQELQTPLEAAAAEYIDPEKEVNTASDAIEGAKLLELVLTRRDCGNGMRAPMCGIPFHAYQSYADRLVSEGREGLGAYDGVAVLNGAVVLAGEATNLA